MAKAATKQPAASAKPKNFKASLENKAIQTREAKTERAETHPPRVRRKQ